MKVKLNESACAMIEQLLNHGKKVVLQRRGTEILIMEETRQIRLRAGNDDSEH